jgi:long-chain fatty acid transport protein
VARTDSSTAAYLNPALLGGPGPKTFRVGYQVANFALRADSGAGARSLADATGAVQFGLRLPLSLGEPLHDRLGLGLDISTPAGVLTRVSILDPARGQFPLLAGRADALDFAVGAGAELPFGIRVGAGFTTLASVAGRVAIGGGASGVVESRVNDELVMVTAPVVGARFERGSFAFGAVYRGELDSNFDLDVTLDDLGQLVLPPLSVVGLAQYAPAQLQFEAEFDVRDYSLVLGLSYELWSKLHTLRGPTIVCPQDMADCSQPGVPQLHTRDTWIPRFAVTRAVELSRDADAEFSLGYFYEPSPLPSQTGPTNLWDDDRHVLSLGYRLLVSDPGFVVDLGVQRHFLVTRVHHKLDRADERAGAYRDVRTSGAVWVSNLGLEVPF